MENKKEIILEVTDLKAGYNEIHVYGVDAGLVLQKLVLYRSGLAESYLGPQESPQA